MDNDLAKVLLTCVATTAFLTCVFSINNELGFAILVWTICVSYYGVRK